jgi:hypothetical protein
VDDDAHGFLAGHPVPIEWMRQDGTIPEATVSLSDDEARPSVGRMTNVLCANWGETKRWRRVVPLRLVFSTTGWTLEAWDCEGGSIQFLPMADIVGWEPVSARRR